MERRTLIRLGLFNFAAACSSRVTSLDLDGGGLGDLPSAADSTATTDSPLLDGASTRDGGVDVPTAPAVFGVGRAADHPEGVWKLFAERRVIVGRDASGFFAFSATCTHESTALEFRSPMACTGPAGCTSMSRDGFAECPLHFARFGSNGEATRGPATVSLRHFRVVLVDGEVRVDPSQEVDPTERTAAG